MDDRNVELTLKLTRTQLDQLRTYVEWAGDARTYYGNKTQFLNRHKAIKEALAMADRVDGWDYD